MSLRGAEIIVVSPDMIYDSFHHLVEKFEQRPILVAFFDTNPGMFWVKNRMAYHITEVTDLRWSVMCYDLSRLNYYFGRHDPDRYMRFDSLNEFRKYLDVERILHS